MNFEIDVEPIGRRFLLSHGDTILSAALHAGIVLNATCGGEGVCGRCLVRVMAGQVSTAEYAQKIGADAFARDSAQAVTLAKSLLQS